MQKKLIALAVAALAGSAAYADSVIMYGRFDGGLEYYQAKGTNLTDALGNKLNVKGAVRVNGNSSYFGIKGVEDLGGGLKGLFQLEQSINLDAANSSILGSRDTFVGLGGGFGTVMFGNLTSTSKWLGDLQDMPTSFQNAGINSTSNSGIIGETYLGGKTGASDRLKNAVAYLSPSFEGLTVTAMYTATNEIRNTLADGYNKQGKGYEIGLRYKSNIVDGGISYLGQDIPFSGTNTDNNPLYDVNTLLKSRIIRAAVAVKLPSQTRITGVIDNTRLKWVDHAVPSFDSTKLNRTAFGLGIGQQFGADKVWLQGAMALKSKSDQKVDDSSAIQYTLGYAHDLSQRTALHAYATQIKNKQNANYGFYTNPVTGQQQGSDPMAIGVGLRHLF